MDSIDITDSTFSLAMPDINNVMSSDIIGGSIKTDYNMYMYIGVAILIGLIGVFVYKYYKNKKNNQSEIDCPGGFCTINQNNTHEI
jgi:hypothetical protein